MARNIHPLDQIELHKQTGDMVHSTLINKAMAAHEMKDSLVNISSQLQIEKASSQAKDNRIKTLEEIIIGLGHNPKDTKSIESLVKKKDEDIVALRKQLKLLASRHPQIEEIIQKNSEEEMMDLLLKMNERLDERGKELEQALKDRESITTQAGTGTSAEGRQKESTQVDAPNPSSDELVKQMDSLKLRVSEL